MAQAAASSSAAAVLPQDAPLPAQRYFTTGEAAKWVGVPAHVLRYWEGKFPTLDSVSRRNGRRYYRAGDILLARRIRDLLKKEGYTLAGALAAVSGEEQPRSGRGGAAANSGEEARRALEEAMALLS